MRCPVLVQSMDRLWRYSVWISSRLLVCSGLTSICSVRTGPMQAPNVAPLLWRQRHQVASCLFDLVRHGDHQKGLQLRHGEGEGMSNDSRVYGKTSIATMTWPLKPAWFSENPCVDLELLRIKHSNRAADLAWEYNSHIQSKYQGAVPIFTDGSKDHKTEATGAAVVVPGYQVALSKRTPNSLSVCAVELFAVLMALQWSERSDCGAVLICSDSVSALTSIKTGTSRGNCDLLGEVLSVNSRVARQGKRVAFMWVPAHSGISGNERADKLAKEAVRRGEVEVNARSLESQGRRVVVWRKAHHRKQRLWNAAVKGRSLHSVQGRSAKHRQQILMSRLRFGHGHLNSTLFLRGNHPRDYLNMCMGLTQYLQKLP